MANNSTNTTEDDEVHTVSFPFELYKQASNTSAEDQLKFIVQVLEEMTDLFEQDWSSVSWEENTVENFLNIVNQQVDGLHACSHSAEAWELIRKELRIHLERVHMLAASTFTI
ncbi:hypothetical protein LDENG_00026860 [Lucifuga dentata]|nr:hypothetical protein LDENG_00026860 [Lucifuga dentata]